MSGTIDTLMKAYRFKLRLEIGGCPNPGYSLLVTMANRLGVRSEEVDIESTPQRKPYVWLSDHTTPNQRAWIPDMQNREGDFHVLCPFFFLYHLNQLRKHEPDFPAPKIDNLYVLLLWASCFGSRQAPLSARILKDLLAWEKRGILTAHTYAGLVGDEIPIVASKVASLKEMAQLYLGFWTGREAWDLSVGNKVSGHPLNQRSRKYHDLLQPGVASAHYPVLVRQYVWEIDQLNTITKSAWALDKYAILRKPENASRERKCLMLRLEGKTEVRIQQELGFQSSEEYYKWQVGHLLDRAPGRMRNPLEDWLKACKFFELEPSKELMDQVTGTNGERGDDSSADRPLQNSSPKEPQPATGFRAGPDYRSVVAANGRQHSLTPKQAQVVSILHEAILSGTPELSQAHLIEEVYRSAKSNNLKKLFSGNEAWSDLIESGKRRGLFRLIVHQSENQGL